MPAGGSAKRPVGGDEPVTLAAGVKVGGRALEPRVRALGARSDDDTVVRDHLLAHESTRCPAVEDDDGASPSSGRPGAAALDELLLRDVGPPGAENVASVDENDGDFLSLG
jgi:hypothetical protein